MGIIRRCRVARSEIRHLERPLFDLALLGGLRIFAVNPSGQSKRLAAFPALRKQERHRGIAAILPPVLRLAILKARRLVGMDAAAQLFVAVLPIQAFRDAVAHVSVMLRSQFRNSQ